MTDERPDAEAKVTRLPTAQPDPEPPVPTPLRGMHAAATGMMALFAVIGIALTLLLVTVSWTPYSRRIVVIALVVAGVLFIASAAAAVLAGSRMGYRPGDPAPARGDD